MSLKLGCSTHSNGTVVDSDQLALTVAKLDVTLEGRHAVNLDRAALSDSDALADSAGRDVVLGPGSASLGLPVVVLVPGRHCCGSGPGSTVWC